MTTPIALTDEEAALVADALQQSAGRQGHHEIGREEAELDQHRLCVVEVEGAFQMRDQDVVEAGHEAPHEKQRGEEYQRHGVVVVGATCSCR